MGYSELLLHVVKVGMRVRVRVSVGVRIRVRVRATSIAAERASGTVASEDNAAPSAVSERVKVT